MGKEHRSLLKKFNKANSVIGGHSDGVHLSLLCTKVAGAVLFHYIYFTATDILK